MIHRTTKLEKSTFFTMKNVRSIVTCWRYGWMMQHWIGKKLGRVEKRRDRDKRRHDIALVKCSVCHLVDDKRVVS
jgi:hypothetical protein